MGLTFLTLHVARPDRPRRTLPVKFLVDSGVIFSVVPEHTLAQLGIKPVAEQEFHLADGSSVVRKKGVALFRYRDRVGGAGVIFGEKDDSALLGAHTLESLGLALDPLRRTLTPLPMILAASDKPQP